MITSRITYFAVALFCVFLLFRPIAPHLRGAAMADLAWQCASEPPADSKYPGLAAQAPHAPRRGIAHESAHPIHSSAHVRSPRRGGSHTSRPPFPKPNCQRASGDTSPSLSMRRLRIILPIGPDSISLSRIHDKGPRRPGTPKSENGTNFSPDLTSFPGSPSGIPWNCRSPPLILECIHSVS